MSNDGPMIPDEVRTDGSTDASRRADVVLHISVSYAAVQSPTEIARHIRAILDECARVGVRCAGRP